MDKVIVKAAACFAIAGIAITTVMIGRSNFESTVALIAIYFLAIRD